MLKTLLQEKRNINTGVVGIFLKGNKMLTAIRKYENPGPLWTNPGGRCDENETIEETLRREIEEETGINDTEIIDFLGEVPGYYKKDDTVLVFICKTSQNAQTMEPEKFESWQWLQLDEIPGDFVNPPLLDLIRDYLNR